MNRFLNLAVFIIASVLILASCKKDEEKPKVFSVTPSSLLNMVVGDKEQLRAEPVIETYTWESTAPGVATVSAGLVEAVSAGDAIIKVTCGKTVKEVPVKVASLIPITGINLSKTSLELYLGDANVTITTTLLPTNNNVKDATLEWVSSDETVVTVTNGGEIRIIGIGTAKVTVSLKSDPNIKAEIDVTVNYAAVILDLDAFEEYSAVINWWDELWAGGEGPVPINCDHAKVNLYEGGEIEIPALSQADIAKVYNRDFMDYDAATGKLIFTGKSGEWDVFYSEKYQYIWINKMDAESPDYWWMMGMGIFSAPTWSEDMVNIEGWGDSDIRQKAFMKPIGDGKFQAHVYLSNEVMYTYFRFSIFSNVANEGKISDISLNGDIIGIKADKNEENNTCEIRSTDDGDFVPGYFCVVYDTTDDTMDFKRLSD